MKKIVSVLVICLTFLLVISSCQSKNIQIDSSEVESIKETKNKQIDSSAVESLREAYPEYFDLSAFKGLEVYVCQFAPENYYFSLVEGTNRNKSMWELMELKRVSAKEMRDILSTYDIDDEDIVVIPWQNPYSSYIGEYHTFLVGEDEETIEKQKKAYIEKVRDMLGLE